MRIDQIIKVDKKKIVQHYDDGDNGFDTGYNYACKIYDSKEIEVDRDKLARMAGLCEGVTIGQAEFIANTIANNLDKIVREKLDHSHHEMELPKPVPKQ